MLFGDPATKAKAPFCANVTLSAVVSGASENGPFCASTVETAYRFAADPEGLETMNVFNPSGENAAAVAFGICNVIAVVFD